LVDKRIDGNEVERGVDESTQDAALPDKQMNRVSLMVVERYVILLK
jgi:hypothetical protein